MHIPYEQITEADIARICEVLQCEENDLSNFEAMKVGLTNSSFSFECKGDRYVLRLPGAETDEFLSRECEAQSEELAKELGLDVTVLCIDPKTGWKLSSFIEGCDYIDPVDFGGDLDVAMDMMRKFHNLKVQGCWDMNFIERANVYIDRVTDGCPEKFEYRELHEKVTELSNRLDQEGFERVLCHNDVWFWNFLKDVNGRIHLIDWEYAGNNYPQADIADYVVSLDISEETYLRMAEVYSEHELSLREKRFFCGMLCVCSWHWAVWACYKAFTGVEVEDFGMWYDKTNYYLARTWEMFEE